MPDNLFLRIAHKLAPEATLTRVWPLAGGISAGMTALELAYPGGRTRRVVVRQPGARTLERWPDAAATQYRLLQLTRQLGLKTQAPLLLDDSATIVPTPYLVFEYIEGQMRFAPPYTDAMLRQLAAELAAIHRADYARFDVSFLRQQPRDAAGILGARPAQPDRSLDQGRIYDMLQAAWPWQRNAMALLHGDYWPGNVLWRRDTLAAIVDWEDAQLGDPLYDLAIARLDLIWIFGTRAMETFTQHYRACSRLDYTALPYWDLKAALRFVRLAGADLASWAAFFEPFGRPDITEHWIREQYTYFVGRALEQTMV